VLWHKNKCRHALPGYNSKPCAVAIASGKNYIIYYFKYLQGFKDYQIDSLPHPGTNSKAHVRKSEHEGCQWIAKGEFNHYLRGENVLCKKRPAYTV
jgi:hypothetical protein